MSCETALITSGMENPCINNTGGVKRILITDAINVNIDKATDATDKEITSITMDTTTQFWQFIPTRNGASLEETATPNFETGSTFYSQTVIANLPYRDATRTMTVEELMEGQKDLNLIVEDGNGIYWFIGLNNYAKVSDLAGGTGTSKDELNGYTLTFLAEEPEMAYEVDSTLIEGLLTPAS